MSESPVNKRIQDVDARIRVAVLKQLGDMSLTEEDEKMRVIETKLIFQKLESLFKLERRGIGIDPSVRGLVLGLNGMGIKTTACCEGHLDQRERPPFPWVGFIPGTVFDNPHKKVEYEKLLERFNSNKKIKWEFHGPTGAEIRPDEETLNSFGITPDIVEGRSKRKVNMDEAQLQLLQGSAKELGGFLARTHLSGVKSAEDREFFKRAYAKAGVDLGE